MSWSLGEAQSLGIKAARGAGLPWGLAEEAGFALRWLQARGLPGAQALAGYLTGLQDPPQTQAQCPLRLGTALCDDATRLAALPCFEPQEILHPLLLLPFAATVLSAERPNESWLLTWPDACFQIRENRVSQRGKQSALLAERSACQLHPGGAEGLSSCPSRSRMSVDASVIARLESLAGRTYAPASERSRLTGAGAGTVDQD